MDIAQLSQLIETHGKDVYGFCYKLTRNRHLADDLYQETFLKAVELCHKIDSTQNPKGFFITIAANTWQNQRRKLGWRHRIAKMEVFQDDFDNAPGMIEGITPELTAISNELNTMLNVASASLDDKLQIPLYMYYTSGMSVKEIASSLKIPIGTVKSRLHRARKMIKKHMEVNGYEGF